MQTLVGDKRICFRTGENPEYYSNRTSSYEEKEKEDIFSKCLLSRRKQKSPNRSPVSKNVIKI